ncbi:MAG: hypothetical protein KJ556_04160 [Gammaproteobacteria bacterium]|nr:hypothetical protein [Gammaproteobacteria bacterium]MBU2057948.1 hypothetical protein [Gammaproteobacteria bacterium]MBU2174300.1 hypothetical protein [Gammaproteobacteria bacterium]MBU2247749.1 hypothetical protein [Gammaproteobacteria bacterium]MBU2344275.1 hypothetical protein [Gammaproteobacteria bacterium]
MKSQTGDADYVNRLIPLLQTLFATINKWFYFMRLNASTKTDSLHLFLKKMIEETLAGQLSSMLALQQRICTATKGIVNAPDTGFYRSFEPVWFNGQNSQRGLSLTDETDSVAIGSLANNCSRIFHSVFDVFVQVIEHATQAFYQQENQPTPYPDTALLMAFSQLMETQQKVINQFSTKHLDFYYDHILQQSLQSAQADQVFVCLKLADKAQPLNLPAGTLFKAGSYPDQSGIVFANLADTEINHAMISSVQTLYYDQAHPDARVLYLNTIANPAQVSRNPLEEIVSWDGFGNNEGLPVQQGFALASPLLFLQGGLRTISVTLTFQSDSSSSPCAALTDFIQAFPTNQFYLSTEKTWFALSQGYIKILAAPCGVEISITLPPEAPAIAAFIKSPDGFSSAWPLLKIMLSPSVDLSMAPGLAKVSIQVQVDQFSHFSLANTSSLIPNTGSQQLLGPVPVVGDCFYVGSNECFAKPLGSLTLNINWDKLPSNFCDYYAQYNQYLFTRGVAEILSLVAAAVTAATTALSDVKTAANQAKGTSAETQAAASTDAVLAAQAALSAANSAVKAAKAAVEGSSPPPDTAQVIASVAAAITSASIAVASASVAATKATEAAVGTTAAAATAKAQNTVLAFAAATTAAAVATAASIFTNTSFTGQWSLLTSTKWQGLLPDAGGSPLPPVKPAKRQSVIERIGRMIEGGIALLSPILPPFLRPMVPVGESSQLTEEAQMDSPAPTQMAFTPDVICLFQQSSTSPGLNLQSSSFTFTFNPICTAIPQLALSPLPVVTDANNGYLRFDLEKPDDAFGNSLYAQVISYISFNNAQALILKDKTAKPIPIPNPPYSPKLSSLQGSYSASAVTEISPEQNTDPQAYPLQLYHYGSFKPYLAYDATHTEQSYGFCNLTPQDAVSAGLPLFAGAGGQGCLYLSLSGVVAPCTLTLFAEISADDNQASAQSDSIGYYYWTNNGWQPIKVLQNGTNNLTCPGIITFDIPSLTSVDLRLTAADQQLSVLQQVEIEQAQKDLSYLVSPIMPNADFWLAIATKPYGKAINIKFSYLDTQAVKLTRVSTVGLPAGEIPQIDANSISATQNKWAQIVSITQPFPSFGGLPAENRNSYGGYSSFYRRVSERLNNKDRCVTPIDLVDMAHSACINLYYAKVIKGKGGAVRIGLVKGYSNAQLPNAFRPVVDALDQGAIVQHISCRTSAMTKLSVFNLKHQILRISTTLLIEPQANANAMEKAINQQLRVYLSPWIQSDLPQRSLTQDINQSELIRFLSAQAGVVSVSALSLMVCVEVDNDDEAIVVSHQQHAITLVTVAGGQA